MATNIATSLRLALAAILTADTTVQTLTGRATKIVVRWQGLATAARPVYALHLVTNTRTGGLGDRRAITAQLSCIAEGDDALTTVEALAQRAREVLTAPALLLQGLDVIVGAPDERHEADDDPIPGAARVDLDLPLFVTAP